MLCVLQDGVAFVHQCPIMPGHEFTYRFPITDSPGTCKWLTSCARLLLRPAAWSPLPISLEGVALP